ncbi:MAG: sodium dependent transporter [Thermodesulfobacteriota bacterium]
MDNPFLLMLVTVTIFCLMLSMGVSHSFQQLASLWRQPELLLRSILAVIVLVPAVVGLLLWMFELPLTVATGLAVLAAAPGAPLTYKRSQMAGGDLAYTAGLQLTLALLAVVMTPLILVILGSLFELGAGSVKPFEVASQVAGVTFLPAMTGLIIQHFAPTIAGCIGKPLRILADILFIILIIVVIILLVLSPDLRMTLNLGWLPTATIIMMVASSLAIGHLLGGPSRAQRSALAIASIARNVGLALFIAQLSNYGENFIPTLLNYMILGGLLAVPYSVWRKRQMPYPDKGTTTG